MYCDWPQLGRCCFCLPLRKGVIVFGYANMIFSAFMIGLLSYTIHNNDAPGYLLYSRILDFPAELCITIYCAEVIFTIALIYGAHMKNIKFIKAYYYFALVSTVGIAVLQIIEAFVMNSHSSFMVEMLVLIFAGLCIQVYLLTIIRSLLLKMEGDKLHVYENPLNQIVTGEVKIENNGVYNNLTTPSN